MTLQINNKYFAVFKISVIFGLVAFGYTNCSPVIPSSSDLSSNSQNPIHNLNLKIVRNAQNSIPGSYIVGYKNRSGKVAKGGDEVDVDGEGTLTSRRHNAKIKRTFRSALKGHALEMTSAEANLLAKDPRVAFVEEDSIVTADTVQVNPTWGLDRIDQKTLPIDGSYEYTAYDGRGVNAYIIDTGIRTTHLEFEGRASFGANFNSDGRLDDCAGHGTHVAGTVGGATFGVAKKVNLVAVRVLNCSGAGAKSEIIAGVDWVTANHKKPAVANMSLGGPVDANSVAQVIAVQNSIAAGVTYIIAAGNQSINACLHSPALTFEAITVGSTNTDITNTFDTLRSTSNWGSCVDIFAPGSNITSAWYLSDSDTNTISGTSMATPHVTGAVARLLSQFPLMKPAQVADRIISSATPGLIQGDIMGSPNLILNIDTAPRAIISGTPSGLNNVNSIVAAISSDGNGAVSYKYKWGSGDIFRCSDATPFSAAIPVTTPISLNVSSILYGPVSVCVLSVTANGRVQMNPTVATWTRDLFPKSILTGAPTGLNNSNSILVLVSSGGDGAVSYKYKWGSGVAFSCTDATPYSAVFPMATSISLNVSSALDGPVKLCVLAQDVNGKVQVKPTVATWSRDVRPPTVTIIDAPTSPNNLPFTTLLVDTVVEPNNMAVTFKYKWGFGATFSCAGTAVYSVATPIGTSVDLDFSKTPDGPVKFCAIGIDSTGHNQVTATEVSWARDSTAPHVKLLDSQSVLTPVTSALVPSYVSTPTFAVQGVEPDYVKYQYKWANMSELQIFACDVFNYTDVLDGNLPITLNLAGHKSGTIVLCVRGVDALGNIQAPALESRWYYNNCDAPGVYPSADNKSCLACPADSACLGGRTQPTKCNLGISTSLGKSFCLPTTAPVTTTTVLATGTWTKPATALMVRVQCWGGGGGAGGIKAGGGGVYMGSGGGGAYNEDYFMASSLPAATAIAVTIGAGGAGGSTLGTSGAAGGKTSFGTYLAAFGGGGGGGISYAGTTFGAGAGGGGGIGGVGAMGGAASVYLGRGLDGIGGLGLNGFGVGAAGAASPAALGSPDGFGGGGGCVYFAGCGSQTIYGGAGGGTGSVSGTTTYGGKGGNGVTTAGQVPGGGGGTSGLSGTAGGKGGAGKCIITTY